MARLQTVVETAEYQKQADHCMDNQARQDFINYIAQNPTAGDLIQGAGGARKIRWAANNQGGKRGGVRVIYYFYDANTPLFLLTVYGKQEKSNLTQAERNMLKVFGKQIVEHYQEYSYE